MVNYDELASIYDDWSSGDRVYAESALFYRSFVTNACGLIVELGIGTGRIGGRIADEQSRMVVGVDSSQKMLGLCRAEFAAAIADGRLALVQEDMVQFITATPARYVIMPFRTIGHIETDEDLATLFTNVRASLQRDGVFVFDHYVLDHAWALQQVGQGVRLYEDDATCIEDAYSFDFQSRRMHCTVSVNGTHVSDFSFRWYEPEAIRQLACETGLVVDALYGNFGGAPFTTTSSDQIWVLKKG